MSCHSRSKLEVPESYWIKMSRESLDTVSPITVLVSILVPILPNSPAVYICSTFTIYYPCIPIPLSIYLSLSLSFLPHIWHLIIDPSDGLSTGVVISIPCLSHHLLIFFDLPYDQLGTLFGIVPIHLGCPQPLT